MIYTCNFVPMWLPKKKVYCVCWSLSRLLGSVIELSYCFFNHLCFSNFKIFAVPPVHSDILQVYNEEKKCLKKASLMDQFEIYCIVGMLILQCNHSILLALFWGWYLSRQFLWFVPILYSSELSNSGWFINRKPKFPCENLSSINTKAPLASQKLSVWYWRANLF